MAFANKEIKLNKGKLKFTIIRDFNIEYYINKHTKTEKQLIIRKQKKKCYIL